MTPNDLATLPVWAADELRRQAEEIAALEAIERRAGKIREVLRYVEHKVDQTMHGQYSRGQALPSVLWATRDVLASIDVAAIARKG